MKNITKYFRNAILAENQTNIDISNENYVCITWEELSKGKVINFDFRNTLKFNNNNTEGQKDIIIALKTISDVYSDGGKVNNKLDDMTAIFFLPAKIDFDGKLYFSGDKSPWIPREFLTPMCDAKLSIGAAADYDNFLESYTEVKHIIKKIAEEDRFAAWTTYLQYAIDMYESVTHQSFSENEAVDYSEDKNDLSKIQTTEKFYLFIDSTINATYHILGVYDKLKGNNEEPNLYAKITSGEKTLSKQISDIDVFSNNKLKYHSGQMNGEYPLSPSQREAISCFKDIDNGEVLAVNGPPGTGKTTLLQTVVANMYVNAAISKQNAPLIVATSTNNQAVTNIIDSFGKVNPIGISNLESRWICGVNSFSVYFPSARKVSDPSLKQYQCTDVDGNNFFNTIESDENRNDSKEFFKDNFCMYSQTEFLSFDTSIDFLHDNLIACNIIKDECVDHITKLKSYIGNDTIKYYKDTLNNKISKHTESIKNLDREKETLKQQSEAFLSRKIELTDSYNCLPWYVRIFKFLPFFKKKITDWSYNNIKTDELDFLKKGMTIEEITKVFQNKIDETDKKILDTISKRELQQKEIDACNKTLCEIDVIIKNFVDTINILSDYNIHVEIDKLNETADILAMINIVDKIRYVKFWLAVHYYEAVWLNTDCTFSEKQKLYHYENLIRERYQRLSMVAPCFVMTCFMLPYNFKAAEGRYLYDFADLLIVDEAGQISPEIGCASFAFAKKAIVVGDVYQIPPVWGTSHSLDISMAISNEVINSKDEFSKLQTNGLNCSESSVMKIASLSCKYSKFENGLFLSEHRRCYNEIIKYSNDLIYNGHLEPLRGSAKENSSKYVLQNFLPPIGYKQIDTNNSKRVGTSRANENEAKQIVEWLSTHYPTIRNLYIEDATKKGEHINTKNLLGIITPFKKQSNIINQILHRSNNRYKNEITVGTVHTFQGSERNIIIFSSVYGKFDGCYFIDFNKSLMNVAVSRAKDSFVLFGDINCLSGGENSASSLLKNTMKDNSFM